MRQDVARWGVGRILALGLIVALGGFGALGAGAAGARVTPERTVRSAFAGLDSSLHRARGVNAGARRALLATARRAQRQEGARRACAGLHTLEQLRAALRRSRARGVGGLYAVEVAILGTARGAGCAERERQVRIEPAPLVVGGPLKPLAPVHAKPDEHEGVPPIRLTRGAGRPNPGPPTNVVPVPAGSSYAIGKSDPFSRSADPFAFSMITDVGTPPEANRTSEPDQAAAGRVVWYTGNDDGTGGGAAYSLDGGAHFTQIDPRVIFPEGDNAFCCDQVVVYAPQINRFIWYIQYWCRLPDQRCDKDGSTNQVRIAVASPEGIASNPGGAWTSWIIHPADVGQRRCWLDFPDLGVGAHSLYLTTNVFGGPRCSAASVVARVNLAALKAAGPIVLRYWPDPADGSYRTMQGAGTRGVLASNDSDTALHTLSWDEGSPLLFPHDTRHSVEATWDWASHPDGFGDGGWNWRADTRVLGATRRGNELWVAWSEGRSRCLARCDPDHPRRAVLQRLWQQPIVHVVVVDTRTFRLVGERFVYNPSYAIGFPALATDADGQVAMTFAYGGGSAGNSTIAAGYLTGAQDFRQVATSPADGEAGDYSSLRPAWPDGTQLTASGYVSDPGPDGYPVPRWLFYRFSRPAPSARSSRSNSAS